jgi:hypothetical protein
MNAEGLPLILIIITSTRSKPIGVAEVLLKNDMNHIQIRIVAIIPAGDIDVVASSSSRIAEAESSMGICHIFELKAIPKTINERVNREARRYQNMGRGTTLRL